jgi:cysteinyl-tRNA synthetase
MDLHHGGEDLIFPHHENEIAQSEAATGHHPYVKTWVHNAHLTFSKEKMSKSLGNVVNASDFLADYGGEVARMVLLSVHYRSTFDFNATVVDQAVTGLERIYEAKKSAEALRERKMLLADMKAEPVWGGFLIDCDRARNAILDHYANDLNTPGALSELFTLIREWNRCLAEPNALNTTSAILAAQELIKVLEEDVGSVIGIGRGRSESVLERLQHIRALRQKHEGGVVLTDAEINALLDERRAARASKNFKRGDEIRDQLAAAGIEIKDSPQGTTFLRK